MGAAARGDSGSPVVDASSAAVGIVTHHVVDGARVEVVGTRVDVIPAPLALEPRS